MKKQYRGGDCLKRGVGRGLGQFVDLRWGGISKKEGGGVDTLMYAVYQIAINV